MHKSGYSGTYLYLFSAQQLLIHLEDEQFLVLLSVCSMCPMCLSNLVNRHANSNPAVSVILTGDDKATGEEVKC